MDSIIIQANKENLEKMILFIVERYAKLINDKKSVNQMRLVAEEALLNIINYAYPDEKGDIEIRYDYNQPDNIMTLNIIDNGIAFNPLCEKDPDLTVPVEDRQIGGLGIFMIKKIMDIVNYERAGDQNILSLQKFINGS